MIIVVAPYSPANTAIAALGAARKLEIVVSILSEIEPVILINTAHNVERRGRMSVGDITIGVRSIKEISPPTFSTRTIGKFFNLFHVGRCFDEAVTFDKVNLVWLYNGYAFESLFAVIARRHLRCPIILEFEDWHFSRFRGLNPKPIIDSFLWKLAIPSISHGFSVNTELHKQLSNRGLPSTLLPGIVPKQLVAATSKFPPFRKGVKPVTVGYFGGLSREKGVDKLLSAISSLSEDFLVLMCGTGPLKEECQRLATNYPERFAFFDVVSNEKLYELIARCDVIVNPHTPIDLMSGGVFPFKVVEAIASGRLLISTPLPPLDIPGLLDGVSYFDGAKDSLVDKLYDAKEDYARRRGAIEKGRLVAIDKLGELALSNSIRKMIYGDMA